MKPSIRSVINSILVGGTAALMASTFIACSINRPSVPLADDMVIDPIITSDVDKDAGFGFYHGTSCAEITKPETPMRIADEVDIDSSFNTATVVLNGWDVVYSSDKAHDLAGVGVGFDNIQIVTGPGTSKRLTWEGWGALADNNWDDNYKVCYFYTVIAWDDTKIDAMVDHGPVVTDGIADSHVFWNDLLEADDDSNVTALKVMSGFLQNTNFPDITKSQTIAILPRGFGMKWDGRNFITGQTDRDFQQAAYNLKYSAPFIQRGKTYSGPPQPAFPSPNHSLGQGFVSWDTQVILKSNNPRDDFTAAEAVSAVAGADVGLIHPPFSVLPRKHLSQSSNDHQDCLDEFKLTKVGTEDIAVEKVIKNIPYQHAVPILLGWDVGFACSSDDFKQAGVRIKDFTYGFELGEPTGTLRVTLESKAEGGASIKHENYARFNVGVLGFKRLQSTP